MNVYICIPLNEVRKPAVAGIILTQQARVAKLVDALVSGARAERCGGSNPFPGTKKEARCFLFLLDPGVFYEIGHPT